MNYLHILVKLWSIVIGISQALLVCNLCYRMLNFQLHWSLLLSFKLDKFNKTCWQIYVVTLHIKWIKLVFTIFDNFQGWWVRNHYILFLKMSTVDTKLLFWQYVYVGHMSHLEQQYSWMAWASVSAPSFDFFFFIF